MTHSVLLYLFWKVYRPPPPEISLSVCCEYVDSLPTSDSPELFGMDHNANTAYLAGQGRALISNLLAAQPKVKLASAGYGVDLFSIIRTEEYIHDAHGNNSVYWFLSLVWKVREKRMPFNFLFEFE